MSRRAGRLSMGHDMAEKSIKSHKARLVIFCSDASPRLVDEFKKKMEKCKNTNIEELVEYCAYVVKKYEK